MTEQATRVADFSALFEASPYPYLLVATDYVIIGANAAYCRATGRTAPDIVGKHIFEAFPANEADPASTNLDEVRTSIERAIATRRPHTSALLRYAVPIETPDGIAYLDKYWSAVHTPVLDAAGEVLFVAQNAIDVTGLYNLRDGTPAVRASVTGGSPAPAEMDLPQLHAALTRVLDLERTQQDRLKAADRRKDEFLAMLAHELRNPLAPIRTAAELLSRDGIGQELVHKTGAVIGRQVEHLTSLVDDLLDVSRVTRGLVSLERVSLDMKKVVADAVEQARPGIEAKRHQLSVHLCPDPAWVLGDATRLVQVIGNLLNNAAKYTPPGGRLCLDLAVRDDQVVLSVEDDGIGMSGELTRDAFELFTQAERTPDRAQGGLGVGLALVRMLTELHGGTVSARSGGPGRGSTFTVCLPRLATAATGAAGPHRTAAVAGGPLRVLVVDDNADAATMLAMFLEALGHSVQVETGARAGLKRALSERHDICLLDIGMPEMDGYEVARRIRRQVPPDDCMLVAVTGYGQDSDREHAAAAGFDHHLVKPVALAALTQLLDSVVPGAHGSAAAA